MGRPENMDATFQSGGELCLGSVLLGPPLFQGGAGGGEVALFADDAEFAGDRGAGPMHAASDLVEGKVGLGEIGFEFVAAG